MVTITASYAVLQTFAAYVALVVAVFRAVRPPRVLCRASGSPFSRPRLQAASPRTPTCLPAPLIAAAYPAVAARPVVATGA